MFPVETVLACIEVKSSLTGGEKGSLVDALNTCQMAKKLSIINSKVGYEGMIDTSSVPFIVFAFNSVGPDTLLSNIEQLINDKKFMYQHFPDMIVVLNVNDQTSQPFYLYKTQSWIYAGVKFSNVIKKSNKDVEVLLGPFEYLIKNIEHWSLNISSKTMPIEHYTKDMFANSLFIFNKETD